MKLALAILICSALRAADIALKVTSAPDVVKFHLFSSAGTNAFYEIATMDGAGRYFYVTNMPAFRTRFYTVSEDANGLRSEPSDIIEVVPSLKKPSIRLEYVNGSNHSLRHRMIQRTNDTTMPPIPEPMTNHTPRFSNPVLIPVRVGVPVSPL